MTLTVAFSLPRDLAAELERRYFWWPTVAHEPRTDLRILTQAMVFASFAEVRHLEQTLGPDQLVDAMTAAEPGWLDDRSWEFWRGRLSLATGRCIAPEPPRRSFDAAIV